MRTSERFELNGKLPSGSVHVMEEIGTDANRMGYKTREGINIKMMFQTNRKQNHVIIMNLPYPEDLMSFLFDKRVRIWIHIISKGIAMAFMAQEALLFGNQFGMNLDEMKKITRKIEVEKDALIFIKKYLMRRPSFKGFFGVPQYTEKFTEEMYDEYNEHIKKELMNLYEEKKNLEGGLTQRYQYLFKTGVVNLYSEFEFTVPDILRAFSRGDKLLTSQAAIYRILKAEGVIRKQSNYEKVKEHLRKD